MNGLVGMIDALEQGRLGSGSLLTVTLPMRAIARTEAREPVLAGVDCVVVANRREAPTIDQARDRDRLILVAEDDPINQKVLLQQLGLLGHAAEVAGDGAAALRFWKAGRYALVLTDLHMPTLDGYGLASAIRAGEAERPETRRVPILALTTDATVEAMQRVRDAGMDEHLTKPIELAVLCRALERWLPHREEADDGAVRAAPALVDAPIAADETGLRADGRSRVDVSVLQGLVGDDPATLREFLAEFLQCARVQSGEIVESCTADDSARVGSVAHKLKASSRSVGALALGDLCAELERASSSGSRDEIVEHCRRFEREMQAVDACIVSRLARS